jgi:muramoyltetrapeptide carboxypeptidase
MDRIDFDLIQQNPKVFMGFSDLTALHLAFYQKAGLGGFYAPMLTTNLIREEAYSQSALLELVQAKFTLPYQIPNKASQYICINPGQVDAPITGGNMTLLASLCGTAYQPETDGHILFLEDWHEKHYSLDRKYQQLKLSGVLDNIKGLVFCDFSAIEPEAGQSLPELFAELTTDLQAKGIPVGYGFSIGHGEQTGTIPYGIHCRFDAKEGNLNLLESPFTNS